LKTKALTRKEIHKALDGLSRNCLILREEILEIKNIFSLYLQYKKEVNNFNKFVRSEADKFEQKQKAENKK
jgi:hypothetical protein